MSKRIIKQVTCACCGKDVSQYQMISRFIVEGQFVSKLMDLNECPNCHYVNYDLDFPTTNKKTNFVDIVNSDEYKSYFPEEKDLNDMTKTETYTQGYVNAISRCKAYALLNPDKKTQKECKKVIAHYENLISKIEKLEKN